jgi:hypothetical protein
VVAEVFGERFFPADVFTIIEKRDPRRLRELCKPQPLTATRHLVLRVTLMASEIPTI